MRYTVRKMTNVLFVLALPAAVVWSGGVVAGQQDMVKTHIGHVTMAFNGTPNGQGLLPTAVAEAKIAAQHAALALKSEGNLDAMKLHAGHVGPHLAHLNMLAQPLVSGVDSDKNGQIGWQEGEGGLQQAEMHMNLLVKGEGM